MIILEFLGNVISTILIGYLSFTNNIANYLLPQEEQIVQKSISDEKTIYTEELALSSDLSTIKSKYEYGGVIPRVLLENSEYQQAALASGAQAEPIELFEKKENLSQNIADALVNIYCQFETKNYIRTTTGTGFIISSNGVILTNAHVAQFLLFDGIEKIKNTQCIIRTGTPAKPTYEADLLYIPPTWISNNANLISAETPRGTGERDYALLYISKELGTTTFSSSFNSLSIETELMARNTAGNIVYVAGYPAEKLFSEGPEAELIPQIGTTTVGELYTFGSNYADVFSIKDSIAGEQGSSGGPIIRENGNVIGLIVTKGNPETDGEKSLRGLTLSYINRTIKEETGFSLLQNMQGDLLYRSKVFKKALAPFLSKLLEFELE